MLPASVIRRALAERDVSVGLVSQIKQRMEKAGESDRQKSAPVKTAVKKSATKKSTPPTSKALTADNLIEAKKLVNDLGGIDRARQALKYLEELG